MIFRILALFVIALALNSILRRVLRPLLGGHKIGGARMNPRGATSRRRRSNQPEPAEFEIIDDETP